MRREPMRFDGDTRIASAFVYLESISRRGIRRIAILSIARRRAARLLALS